MATTQEPLGQRAFEAGRTRNVRRGRKIKASTPYLLLLPAILLVAGLLLYPMLRTIYLSFFSFGMADMAAREFVGWSNYRHLAFDSQELRSSLRFTVMFTIITIVIELVLAFAFALVLDTVRRGRAVLATIGILPFMVASIAVGLVWRLLFARDVGLVNHVIGFFGFEPVNWLAMPGPAMASAIIAEIWATMPFVMLILLAGLTSIPGDVLEAGRTDGAKPMQLFRYVTFPLLLPSFTVALVFQTVLKIRVFDLVFILTEGGPGGLTTPLGLLIYRQFFRYSQSGLASASSVILLLFGGIICVAYVKLLYREVEY
ncbi:MAG: sugar ABC transporter permease [Dehalococcoidia bacterium]